MSYRYDGPRTSVRGLLTALGILWVFLFAVSCGEDALVTPTATPAPPTAPPTPTPCFTAQTVPDSFSTQVALTTTADGLQIGDIKVGCGAAAQQGSKVTVQYTGWLSTGTQFDTSRKAGGSPFPVTVGAGGVIKGWDEGLIGMKVGGKRRLIVPPALGYGATGAGGVIPPNATLTFDIELLSVS